MSVSRPRIPFTYDDYKSLPESTERRYELLAGHLFKVPTPTTRHQRICRNIEHILIGYVRRTRRGQVLDGQLMSSSEPALHGKWFSRISCLSRRNAPRS